MSKAFVFVHSSSIFYLLSNVCTPSHHVTGHFVYFQHYCCKWTFQNFLPLYLAFKRILKCYCVIAFLTEFHRIIPSRVVLPTTFNVKSACLCFLVHIFYLFSDLCTTGHDVTGHLVNFQHRCCKETFQNLLPLHLAFTCELKCYSLIEFLTEFQSNNILTCCITHHSKGPYFIDLNQNLTKNDPFCQLFSNFFTI